MFRPIALLSACLLQLIALGSARAQTPGAPPAPALAGAAAPAGPAVVSSYRIGPDDTLDIVVFQVPELSRTVQVDAAGQFTLPVVGVVNAAGRTADELSRSLRDRLDGGYLRDPQVTVLIKQAVSQRVTVDGAVVKPGIYPLTGPTSLLQAVALANGPDPRVANIRRVAVFRSVDGRRQSQVYDLSKIRSGRAEDPTVKADDVIVVATSGTKSFFTYFGGSLPILSILRPY
ncbi:MAG TPA: polysaccharide biosynthesis/export family protein [Phenylobacterium sp.]